jgi:hypothetical protein
VTNTMVNRAQHAAFGMPVSGRVRVSSLRALPMTAVVATCPADLSVTGDVWVTDIATKGDFSGFRAWSPPS